VHAATPALGGVHKAHGDRHTLAQRGEEVGSFDVGTPVDVYRLNDMSKRLQDEANHRKAALVDMNKMRERDRERRQKEKAVM
jgi:hypothetical protein